MKGHCMRLILLTICIILAWMAPRQGQTAGLAPDVADRVLAATVVLRSDDGRDRFLGSGFVYADRMTILSNAHVTGGASRVRIIMQDGTEQGATVVRVDDLRDLVVLRTDDPVDVEPLTASAETVQAGMVVYATGAPLEADFSLTAGIVSTVARQIDPTQPLRYIQHSAPVNPGSSGGPLVDGAGGVLGLNTRISDGSRFFVGIAYAVAMSDVSVFLAATDAADLPQPGFKVRPLSRAIRAALGHDGPGVLIDLVRADTAADRAGIMAGDILISMDGKAIKRAGDVAFGLADGGAAIAIEILREGQMIRTTLDRTPPQATLTGMTQNAPQAVRDYTFRDMGLTLSITGDIVTVSSNAAGFFAGLSRGDRIVAINGRAITSLGPDWSTAFRFDAPILLRIVLPDGATVHYLLDPWDQGNGLRPSSGANVLDQEVTSFD